MSGASLHYKDLDGTHSAALNTAPTSIGRDMDQDIVLRDALVSRRHAIVTRDGDIWTVVDQNSTHGTYVNSVRVQQAALQSGDILQLGSLTAKKLLFLVQQDDSPTIRMPRSSVNTLLSSLYEMQGLQHANQPARELSQLVWLIRAARQLNDGLAIDDILHVLLHLTLQLTGAQRGYVFLSTSSGLIFSKGLSSNGALLQEDGTISRNAIHKAIDSSSPFSVADTRSNETASRWSSVILNEIRSIRCIPLQNRISPREPKELLGLLYLDSQIQASSLTSIDHQLLDTIATEAATLLQNALLAEAEQKARQAREELAVAARIHSGLMSMALPNLPYADLRARSVPCLAIGGDFYDAVVLEDCVCLVIVDVSGKGVSAAIVAATLQGIIHAQLMTRQSLPRIADVVNQFLCTRNVGKYATMIVLRLYPDGRVEYMNCGHLAPLAISGNKIRLLEAGNCVVGLMPGAIYFSAEDELRPGERLVLTTDGVTECEDSEGRVFEEIWPSIVTRCQDIGEILDQVARFRGPNPAQDDCTLVEIKYKGVV
jgi:serine phosphatase RsbU (regulator of sigma subunit)